MTEEFEYYRIHRKADNSVPILNLDKGCPKYLYEDDPIENPDLLKLKLGPPVPKKPKMVDYLSLPESVVSKKVAEVLMKLKIDGIQLLPAVIKGKEDELFSDYWAIHVYKNIKCVDENLSECKINPGNLAYVKKLVLDKKILKDISLNERLIFRLKEDSAYEIFHVSIVDAIMATKPEGLCFTNIQKWTEASLFS
jgi:hypothetical protein